MLIGAVLLYFLLVSAALALVFLPSARAWATARAQRLAEGGRTAGKAMASAGQQRLVRAGSTVGVATGTVGGWMARRAFWIGLALVVIATPPLLALALRGWQELGSFDHTRSHEVNPQVAALLQGEQLVAPPPLPPELFLTREVEQARPLIRYADRKWELLDDDFRQRLLVAYKLMREKHGYDMVLLEGYRSPQRQAELAALGPQVTRAGAFESYHQYGLAADSAFLRDGRIVISERDAWAMRGYEHFGEVTASVGLTWGGSWTLQDYGHAELRRPNVLKNRGDNPAPLTAQEQ
jgi:peptidoglycan L-alanyl-D-glutamate endopeptidase CwlK